jgi:hypothetical protein
MLKKLFILACFSTSLPVHAALDSANTDSGEVPFFVVDSRFSNDARAILGVETSRPLDSKLVARLQGRDVAEANASYVRDPVARPDSQTPTLISVRGALDAGPMDFWVRLDGGAMTVMYLSTGRHIQPDDTVFLIVFVNRKIDTVISSVGGAE